MDGNSFTDHIILENNTIFDALVILNKIKNGILTLFVIDSDSRLKGTLTDGDIRRFLTKGNDLKAPVSEAMNANYLYISSVNDKVALDVKSIRAKGISSVPLIDDFGRILKIYNLNRYKSFLQIDAVLMAGGKGERLRPLTDKTPKPLLPVGDKAIIDYNVERLISFGIDNLFVTVNYLKEQIEEHFQKEYDGVKITCVREPQYLGTMGSVRFVDSFKNDTILIMNSDLFTNIDYEGFYLHFKQHDADMSVAAVPYDISIPYGIFDLDGRNIKGVKEKPIYNYYANAGIYMIKRSLLEMIPANTFFNATDLIEMLIENQMKVVRFPLTGYWIDIGKMDDYRRAQDFVKHIKE